MLEHSNSKKTTRKMPLVTILIIFIGCNNCEKVWKETKDEKWLYRIDSMYISKSHATPMLVISSNSVYKKEIGVYALQDLYNNAAIGDTILKEQGSLEFKLIKRDTALSFYPMCNGEIIK